MYQILRREVFSLEEWVVDFASSYQFQAHVLMVPTYC